jgi:hypothetical protein
MPPASVIISDMESTTQEERNMWSKIASKHYRHESGIEVIYRHNAWTWEVVGGRDDGHCYTTLRVAQYSATR